MWAVVIFVETAIVGMLFLHSNYLLGIVWFVLGFILHHYIRCYRIDYKSQR